MEILRRDGLIVRRSDFESGEDSKQILAFQYTLEETAGTPSRHFLFHSSPHCPLFQEHRNRRHLLSKSTLLDYKWSCGREWKRDE